MTLLCSSHFLLSFFLFTSFSFSRIIVLFLSFTFLNKSQTFGSLWLINIDANHFIRCLDYDITTVKAAAHSRFTHRADRQFFVNVSLDYNFVHAWMSLGRQTADINNWCQLFLRKCLLLFCNVSWWKKKDAFYFLWF